MSGVRVAAAVLGVFGVLLASDASAQQTVRELMDAGGRMAAPAELRALLGLGPAPAAGVSSPAPSSGTVSGPRIDEAGRGCVDGDCRFYWRTADGRWFVSSSPDTAAPVVARPAR